MITSAHRRRSTRRAQTSLDFMAGMAIFLITLGFVFSFVPGMFQPFESTNGPNMVASDRTAALLVEDILVDTVGTPGVVNATCAAEFFDGNGNVGDCRFDVDSDDLNGALGVGNHRSVNVTLESGGSVITVDGVPARAGPAPASTANVVVSKRVVLVDGKRTTVFVRVW